jgi:hypothetical protein
MGRDKSKKESTNAVEQKKIPNSEKTDAEIKREKQARKALANPEQAARNKEENDAKRARREASGSKKVINR